MTFAVSRVFKAGQDVLSREVGEVLEDLFVRHAGSEVAEHVVDRDAHASDAGFSAPLARLHSDSVSISHGSIKEDVEGKL